MYTLANKIVIKSFPARKEGTGSRELSILTTGRSATSPGREGK